jgi:uncharacterized protein (UPF0333 family)
MEGPQMKKLGSSLLIAALVLAVSGVAFAAGKTHDMTVEIVSVDAKAKTITVKDDKGENHTAPLMGAAVTESKNFKVGDKVTVTCKDNDKGDHEGVTAIKKAA